MKDRLKELRKSLGLTQQEFADRIGIKRNTLANYEAGRNIPIDAVFTLIAREFSVSEEWLRTGKGEMFSNTLYDEVDAVVEKYHLDEKAKQCILKFVELSDNERSIILNYMEKVVKAIQDADDRKYKKMQSDDTNQIKENISALGVPQLTGFHHDDFSPETRRIMANTLRASREYPDNIWLDDDIQSESSSNSRNTGSDI